MLISALIKKLYDLTERLLGISFKNAWKSIDMNCDSNGIAKEFPFKDGIQSYLAINKGFIVIYKTIYDSEYGFIRKARHVLINASIENLARFYNAKNTTEIYKEYLRFEKSKHDGKCCN